MPFIRINDINMYYEQYGEGYPLVLIAGFNCNHLFWHPLVPFLSDYYQVLIFDNRGCGRTDSPDGPYTVKMFADDTARLMKALHIENAYVLGHSMGGSILQQLCNDYPQMIRKGMMCASLAKIPVKTLLQIDAQIMLEETGASTEALILNSLPWLYSNHFLSNRDNIDKAVWKMLHNPFPQTRQGFLAQADALRTFDSSHYLKNIKTPLMLFAGDEDHVTPLPCSLFLAKKIPYAKLHVFEQQSHLFVEEKASELSGFVTSFFKN